MKRTCLLTGASGTLGGEFINHYADQYDIIALYHQTPIDYTTQDQQYFDPLAPTTDTGNHHAVYAIRGDLSDPQEINHMAQEALAYAGHVDLVINAAAIRAWSPLLNPSSLTMADQMFSVNVLAPLRLSKYLALAHWSHNLEANLAHNRNIINVSSTAGLFVYPDTGQALYAATKAALNHLTYHLASEFWDIGIRVNAIAPDTFPSRVSTQEVVKHINQFDESTDTGQVLLLNNPVSKSSEHSQFSMMGM